MALLVYKGKEIKIHLAGTVLKRDRPREVNLAAMTAENRATIEKHPDIHEATKRDTAHAKSDVELVLDTPDYEPLPGHTVPTVRKVTKKTGKK